jgi:hypothetical protein
MTGKRRSSADVPDDMIPKSENRFSDQIMPDKQRSMIAAKRSDDQPLR